MARTTALNRYFSGDNHYIINSPNPNKISTTIQTQSYFYYLPINAELEKTKIPFKVPLINLSSSPTVKCKLDKATN